MNDPERLLTGRPGGLATTLLRAGAAEKPSARSLERTLLALGAATTTLGTAGAAGAFGGSAAGKGAALLTPLVLFKWAGVGVASGIALALAAHAVDRKPHREPVVSRTERAAPTVVLPAPKRAVAAPVAEITTSSDEGARAPVPTSAPSSASVSDHSTSNDKVPLAAEVAFVDRGRGAFQRGDADGALTALDGYERTFPDRRLLPEVLYLRMESRAALGDTPRALALARLLLRDFAKTPHAARARALLGEP